MNTLLFYEKFKTCKECKNVVIRINCNGLCDKCEKLFRECVNSQNNEMTLNNICNNFINQLGMENYKEVCRECVDYVTNLFNIAFTQYNETCIYNTTIRVSKSLACINATKKGHLSCLQHFHRCGYYLDEDLAFAAAYCGHLKCLEYLIENNCMKINSQLIEIAANNGQLDCLKYLCEKCGFDISVDNICDIISSSLKYGRVDCYNYLIINAKKFTQTTLDNLISIGKYHDMCNECTDVTFELIECTSARGHEDCTSYLD